MPKYLVSISVTARATEEVELTNEELEDIYELGGLEVNPEVLYDKAEKQLLDRFKRDDFSALDDIELECDDWDEVGDE